VESGVISGKIGKQIFPEIFSGGLDPKTYVTQKGLSQISDSSALEADIDRILAQSPDEVAAYKAGKTKLMGFFVGQVMKATMGPANPALVNDLLRSRLS
jgi:aspartyl-tRNA(Asn)/glutamyl-tRNA(Gln) amidotransferase subunit B